MTLPVSLHNRLRATRRKRALSRKRLARLLGHKTTSQLCRWEQGTQVPTLAHALLLSYLLQMPIEILFKGLRDELVNQMHRHDEGTAEGMHDERIIEG